jgi:hypothetical protein
MWRNEGIPNGFFCDAVHNEGIVEDMGVIIEIDKVAPDYRGKRAQY